VAGLVGVCGVSSRITVPVRPARPDAVTVARQSVARMLGRKGTRVRVAAQDGATIELRGRVRSLALRRAAEHAVRRVLGDVALENRIAVAR
jgi:osmotically-inducible protein OsmY